MQEEDDHDHGGNDVEKGVSLREERGEEEAELPQEGRRRRLRDERCWSPASSASFISILLVFVGAAASAIIVAIGMSAANTDRHAQLERIEGDVLQQFRTAVKDYEDSGLFLNHACSFDNIKSFQDLDIMHEYLQSTGVVFHGASCVKNVTSQEERKAMEQESRDFLAANYPDTPYQGFYENLNDPQPRSEQPFYFPVHYRMPMDHPIDRRILDFDLYSIPDRREIIDHALETWKPTITEPGVKLIFDPDRAEDSYGVVLYHPGIRLDSLPADSKPSVLGTMSIGLMDILIRAHLNFFMEEDLTVYLFDSTNTNQDPLFLGGAVFHKGSGTLTNPLLTKLPEITAAHLHRDMDYAHIFETPINFGQREWTVFILANDSAYTTDMAFVVVAAAMIFMASTGLACWFCSSTKSSMERLVAKSETEKAVLVAESDREAVKNEREMNDFIAHEVRNPVSCAILANSFIRTKLKEIQEDHPITKEELQMLREDTDAIDTSLLYTNELLFNMLDLHRAESYQIKIETAPVDLKLDVLEPVASMLQLRRDSTSSKIELDCPSNLIVLSDRLRLKQMVMNLGRNSTLFCTHGVVRLKGYVVNGTVHVAVEDSGPGIREDMQDTLFCKFRDRLDSLNPGGGLGLSLCKKVADLMGGDIWLDKDYDSGVDGCPGSRFIINLNKPPRAPDQDEEPLSASLPEEEESSLAQTDDASDELSFEEQQSLEQIMEKLPDMLSVLFVDDDALLRKMFKRSLLKVRPHWQIREAATGESALVLVGDQDQEYNLIFMDQYMPGIHKTLLGTDTVRALRSNGCRSIICGLSANDTEELFQKAGADAFLLKPLACGKEALARQLLRLLSCREDGGEGTATRI